MDDDDLLRELAETARREEEEELERLDSRWEALAAGTLPAWEAEALRAEARRLDGGKDGLGSIHAAGRRLPFPDRRRDPEPDGLPRGRDGSRLPAAARRLCAAPARPVVAAGAALAAILLLFVVWPPSGEPLPGYAARLAGGSREMRSGEARVPEEGPPLYLPGNSFELVLTPEREAAGRLAAEAFLAHGGTVSPWPAPVEVSEHGAVRIAGRVGTEVRLPAGSSTVLVAVGRPGSLPTARELVGRVRPGCSRFSEKTVICGLPVVSRERAPGQGAGGSPR